MCGWETAASQIRICIIVSSLYVTKYAWDAIKLENRKLADSYINISPIFVFLLAMTALFDWLAILDSQTDN